MSRIRRWLLPSLLLLGMVLTGCDDSSTEPSETLVFEGTVRTGGESFHALVLQKEGPIRITLARLRAVLVDISVLNPENLGISVGIGQEVEGECQENVQFTLQENGLLFFSLIPQTYCLSVFDRGQLPEDATVAYTVTVDLP